MADELAEKLDILIKLQAAALTAQMESSKDKIVFLRRVGTKTQCFGQTCLAPQTLGTATIALETRFLALPNPECQGASE